MRSAMGLAASPNHGVGCKCPEWACRPWHRQSVHFRGCMTPLLRLEPLLQVSWDAIVSFFDSQSHLKVGRHDRGCSAPNHAADAHIATHLGKTWGLRQPPTTARVPGRPRAQSELPLPAATWAEAKFDVRHTWHNALSLTVLHGSTPRDPQTIPTRVHPHVRALLCSLHMLATTQLTILG